MMGRQWHVLYHDKRGGHVPGGNNNIIFASLLVLYVASGEVNGTNETNLPCFDPGLVRCPCGNKGADLMVYGKQLESMTDLLSAIQTTLPW